ncbi:hypothetical protein [Methylobacterium flocculans]|uniref:hypothetical protein n=1 Tax=Methylobacterium flocculans TaxID=2984843 RepID=UPI0021F2CF3E|nr:hypothetical protein [Methylobacterium sp. FF17]
MDVTITLHFFDLTLLIVGTQHVLHQSIRETEVELKCLYPMKFDDAAHTVTASMPIHDARRVHSISVLVRDAVADGQVRVDLACPQGIVDHIASVIARAEKDEIASRPWAAIERLIDDHAPSLLRTPSKAAAKTLS